MDKTEPMTIQEKMFVDRHDSTLLSRAKELAAKYLDEVDVMNVFPQKADLSHLSFFEEKMPTESSSAKDLLELLSVHGSPCTVAQAGGRYFGFVNGGAVPAAIAVKWLMDVWDQCGGLYFTSPINAKLESICQDWLCEIFGLHQDTVAGFVSGTSMANLCGLAAARYHLLKKRGWDLNGRGLNGSPPIRIIAHRQVHASVKKTLALLGFGIENLESIPADDQGRLVMAALPTLDDSCLVLLQAGNVNTGAFDPFEEVCKIADAAGAWVHIDGAFGLWASASKTLRHLTRGMEMADSWAVDGHKTLNTPYDSGIVLCRHPDALIAALQATSDYITLTDRREPLLYTPEMSKRSRAIELWTVLKYLGTSGIDEMVTQFHRHAQKFAEGLVALGFEVLNEVVFNQVLIRATTDQQTEKVLDYVQKSGTCWTSGSTWQDRPAIRISVCSWVTTANDIDQSLNVFGAGLKS